MNNEREQVAEMISQLARAHPSLCVAYAIMDSQGFSVNVQGDAESSWLLTIADELYLYLHQRCYQQGPKEYREALTEKGH